MDIFLSSIHNILSFIVIISFIVFVHEFGHYIVAKLSGVRIEAFSIGFGKEIFGWNDRSGTRWKISALPLGGYVKMYGDKGPASNPDNEAIKNFSEQERKESFHTKPILKKIAIVAAGPIANYLLAIVILTFFFFQYGSPYSPPMIDEVQPNSPAERAGLQIGDNIITIEGNTISNFSDIQPIIAMKGGEEIKIQIKRDSEDLILTVVPELFKSKDMFGNEIEIGRLGIASHSSVLRKHSLFSSSYLAMKECYRTSKATLVAIGEIIVGKRGAEGLSGPIRIAKYSGQSTKRGIQVSLLFMAILSINLGLINLLPIPMLDGGHLFYYIIEGLTGKPVPEQIQKYGFLIGMLMIIGLSLFALFNDLVSLNIFG